MRLATSESNEHIFGNYHKSEREFTVEIFTQIEDMNLKKKAMYGSELNIEQYCNGRG